VRSNETDILLGESLPMRRLRALIATVAPSRVPVLVQGETGTGKELVAMSLHRGSGRRGALVAFNVCAIGETMFEDALFGHARGAFTGAHSETLGFLREANGGSAFLDEVGSLPHVMQGKLLRAVETGVFRAVGATRDCSSDFRLLAATNETLDSLVTRGRFRADLAHRLSGFVVEVPALRDRIEDIALLANHFARSTRPADQLVVTTDAIKVLQERVWPGNVRELKHVVEVAAIFADRTVTADAVRIALGHREGCGHDVRHATGLVERDALLDVLSRLAWNVDDAAIELGVHRATLYRRMKRLGIERIERLVSSRAHTDIPPASIKDPFLSSFGPHNRGTEGRSTRTVA
jgi:DNA-binding NtrC family response regulator